MRVKREMAEIRNETLLLQWCLFKTCTALLSQFSIKDQK